MPDFERAVTGFLGCVTHRVVQQGLAVLLDKDESADRFATGPILVEQLCIYDLFRLRHFEMDAAHAHVPAVRVAPDPAVLAADADVHFADSHRPSRRAGQPSLDQVRLGVSIPHQVPRGVEIAGDHDLPIPRGHHRHLVHHLRSPFDEWLPFHFREARRHLVQALVHSHFGHLDHLPFRPAMLDDRQFGFAAEILERDDVQLVRGSGGIPSAEGSIRLPSLSARLWIYSMRFNGSIFGRPRCCTCPARRKRPAHACR